MKNVFSLYQDVNPSTSLTLSSNNTAVITKTITKTRPLQQKMHFGNVKAQHLQNIHEQPESIKDLEIQLLQVECEELKNQLGCLRVGKNPVLLLISKLAGKELYCKFCSEVYS